MSVLAAVSVRDDILIAMKDVLELMTDENGDRLWNGVVYGDLDTLGHNELPAACIDAGPDRPDPDTQTHWKTDKTMIVTVGFQFARDDTGEVDNYRQFEVYYAKLVSALLPDMSIGGAIMIREAGAGSEIEGRGDPRPGGYCLFEVVYRHARANAAGKP